MPKILGDLPQRYLVEVPSIDIPKIDLPEEIPHRKIHVSSFGINDLSELITLMNENASLGKISHHAIKIVFPRSVMS